MLLPSGGVPIGMLPGAVHREDAVDLEPGDTLVLYSDGITEALNRADEEFGMERLTTARARRARRAAGRALAADLRGRRATSRGRRAVRRPDGPHRPRRGRVRRRRRPRTAQRSSPSIECPRAGAPETARGGDGAGSRSRPRRRSLPRAGGPDGEEAERDGQCPDRGARDPRPARSRRDAQGAPSPVRAGRRGRLRPTTTGPSRSGATRRSRSRTSSPS